MKTSVIIINSYTDTSSCPIGIPQQNEFIPSGNRNGFIPLGCMHLPNIHFRTVLIGYGGNIQSEFSTLKSS